MQGTYKIMTELIYGGGLRLAECLSLRIKDIDFERQCLTIRSGKGNKDRQTLLSNTVIPALKEHLLSIRKYYESDLKNNIARVQLPYALNMKYPNAGKEWGWFWVFPSHKLSCDPRGNIVRRHHLYTSTLQKAFHASVLLSEITKNDIKIKHFCFPVRYGLKGRAAVCFRMGRFIAPIQKQTEPPKSQVPS